MNEKRFQAKHFAKLDSEERRRQFPPKQILNHLPIKQSDCILDLGSGTGYFSIPAAKMTEGTVYGLDIEIKMLNLLQEKIDENGITNIELLKGQIEEIPVSDQTVDHVIASLVLHEIAPLTQGLAEIHRVLKEDGYCLCLEWEKTDSASGPPLHHRIYSGDMELAFTNAGFRVIHKEFPTPSHYLLIVQKSS